MLRAGSVFRDLSWRVSGPSGVLGDQPVECIQDQLLPLLFLSTENRLLLCVEGITPSGAGV